MFLSLESEQIAIRLSDLKERIREKYKEINSKETYRKAEERAQVWYEKTMAKLNAQEVPGDYLDDDSNEDIMANLQKHE